MKDKATDTTTDTAQPPKTGAQCVIDGLVHAGCEVLFGYPGGAVLDIFNALYDAPFQFVLTRHEQGAVHMADGYARATGKPGCCLVTSGPGATNTVTGLATAYMDGIPLVCITGQVATPLIGTDAFQEVNTYGMSVPITKHNYLVRDARDLLTVIPDAFRIALSDRPGPVLIDVPKDVQTRTVELDAWPDPGQADSTPSFDPEEIVRAAAMINAAKHTDDVIRVE